MSRPRLGLLVSTLLVFAFSACGGDDDRSVEAAEWCRITEQLNRILASNTPGISVDFAGEWAEAAPNDIRASTERAARMLTTIYGQDHPRFPEVREQISSYQAEHCPK
jgi:hypothetical protein